MEEAGQTGNTAGHLSDGQRKKLSIYLYIRVCVCVLQTEELHKLL